MAEGVAHMEMVDQTINLPDSEEVHSQMFHVVHNSGSTRDFETPKPIKVHVPFPNPSPSAFAKKSYESAEAY